MHQPGNQTGLIEGKFVNKRSVIDAGPQYFCAQSQTSVRMSRGTGLLRVASHGLSHPFLKTFTAVFPDLTDRPWVSEDAYIQKFFTYCVNQNNNYPSSVIVPHTFGNHQACSTWCKHNVDPDNYCYSDLPDGKVFSGYIMISVYTPKIPSAEPFPY